MTSTCSATATALPAPLPALIDPLPRRGFLRQLASLPLIGGGVTLLGAPTAVAEPITPDLLEAYKTWLDNERRRLSWAMADDPVIQRRYCRSAPASHEERAGFAQTIDRLYAFNTPAWRFHEDASSPYERAALVMCAVGCNWRDEH